MAGRFYLNSQYWPGKLFLVWSGLSASLQLPLTALNLITSDPSYAAFCESPELPPSGLTHLLAPPVTSEEHLLTYLCSVNRLPSTVDLPFIALAMCSNYLRLFE